MLITSRKTSNTPEISQFPLAGRNAAIAGDARGVGLEVIRALAEAGGSVVIIHNSNKGVAKIASDLPRSQLNGRSLLIRIMLECNRHSHLSAVDEAI